MYLGLLYSLHLWNVMCGTGYTGDNCEVGSLSGSEDVAAGKLSLPLKIQETCFTEYKVIREFWMACFCVAEMWN